MALFYIKVKENVIWIAAKPNRIILWQCGSNLQLIFDLNMRRMPFKSQSMNLVYKTAEGSELWLGDYYAATNLKLLKQREIKSVLTAAAMLGINYPKDQQINHKVINAFDLPSYKMTPHFDEAFHFIENALKQGNVLVHCAAGISRSTTFVIVYLMRAQGMTFQQAMDYVRSKRSIICPNQGFQKELKRYEITVKKLLPSLNKEEKNENAQEPLNKQEKMAVLEFLKQQTTANNKNEVKMNTTATKGQSIPNKTFNNSQNSKNYVGLYRGMSLNYDKKPNYILNHEKPLQQRRQQVKQQKQVPKDMKSNVSKLTQQFLTFKLENPKIVTVKK